MKFSTRVARWLKSLPFPGWDPIGGRMGYGGARILPATDLDMVREAGPLHLNTVVSAVATWKANAWTGMPVCLVRVHGDDEEPVADNPFLDLMRRPMPQVSGRNFWKPLLLDFHAAGNAYLHKQRNAGGRVVGLRWLPAHSVAPASRSAMEYVTHYEYWVQGAKNDIPVEDMIHFRNGLDPDNTRLGMSDLSPVLREIATLNEAATYRLAAVKSPMPGMIVSPDGEAEIEDQDREALADELVRRFSGQRRFRALVASSKLAVESTGYSPEQMALDTLVRYPEQYVCAAMSIPPMVLGYASGRDEATYANYGEAVKAALHTGVIPLQELFGEELRVQLLVAEPKSFGYADDLQVRFDRSHVEALQESRTDRVNRNVRAAGGAYMSVNEARSEAGLDPVEGYDDIRSGGAVDPLTDPRSEAQKLRDKGYSESSITRILGERRKFDVLPEDDY